MLDHMLTAKQAAAYLHTTENSLRTLRCEGKGPPCHRPDGWHVLYRKCELDEYLASRSSDREPQTDIAGAEKERAASGSTPMRP